MFRTADNEKIGKHIAELISGKFKSSREFCREWFSLQYPDIEPPNDEIDKRANKLSQIKQGNKGIQIEDLGYFAELLDVSCEEILSAKDQPASNEYRYTNYNFALSESEDYWEHYIHRDDKIILNEDEYGMTVIDYAIRFKNYKLLKYLVDKEYIWFVDENEYEFGTFSAGTSIEGKRAHNDLEFRLEYTDRLRTDMAALAMENSDFKMLEYLRAREIPGLRDLCFSTRVPIGYEEHYNENLLEHIVNASAEVTDYFTKTFTVNNPRYTVDNTVRKIKCVFPYIEQLIEKMIGCNSKNTARALKNAIKHNKWALDKLSELVTEAVNFYCVSPDYENCNEEQAYHFATYRFIRADKGDYIYYYENIKTGLWLNTNIVHVNARSRNKEINALIKELNDIYTDITELNKDKLIIRSEEK